MQHAPNFKRYEENISDEKLSVEHIQKTKQKQKQKKMQANPIRSNKNYNSWSTKNTCEKLH